LEALIGVDKPNYFTEILRKVVRMCEQCVQAVFFGLWNEARTESTTHAMIIVLGSLEWVRAMFPGAM